MPGVTQLRTNNDNEFATTLDEIAREGARRMLAEAFEVFPAIAFIVPVAMAGANLITRRLSNAK